MEKARQIGYDPDGAQIVNDSVLNIFSKIKNSKFVKWCKNMVKFAKREGSKRPLWKVVLGFITCAIIAFFAGFKKYWINKFFISTLFSIWNALIHSTFGFLIQGYRDNQKIK
tara:strand:- start:1160 stop:1495 length:336 start_codon:yes stop_codon:yes gene_type:complete